MSQSRYIKYDRKTLPPGRPSRPIFGADSQENTFFRCRQCGFICKVGRDSTGNGIGYHAVDSILVTDLVNFSGNVMENSLSIRTIRDLRLIEVNANGDPKVFKTNFTQVVRSGCPQCGSLNWR